jgi:O-acetyl-ADP-ribose deacetylase (regulator of RNase III)
MRIELHFGDITEFKADCIVNAAKPSLLGGGGVDGAIHKKAGIELREFCMTLGGCKVGEAKLSPGFNLDSRFIIHTVGPRYLFKSIEEENLLRDCYLNSLRLAKVEMFKEIVFSNISTGAFGFPKDKAASISLNTCIEFIHSNVFPNKVIFCCYDFENLEQYVHLIKKKL